jgi:Tfp pilus assembly protein PilN
MKALLSKSGFPRAIGLYVEDDAVTLSQVVSTPFGPIEITRCRENADPDDLAPVLKKLVTPLIGRGRFSRVPVAIGVPEGRSYFATRPIQHPGKEASPHVLLREVLRSPSILVHGMAVDVIKSRPDRRPVASIAACDSDYLDVLLEGFKAAGIRFLRVEPAPPALLRAAVNRHRDRRQVKVSVRLILGDARLLAILVADGLPVVWRTYGLRAGDEAAVILSAVRSLTAISKDCGIESSIEAVVLHGRFDLARLLDVDWMEEQIGASLKWYHEPALDGSQVAFGLALGCLNHNESAFDLSHSLRPKPALREIFPWRGAFLQVALLLCMAVFLADRLHTLNDACLALRTQNAQHLWMESLDEQQLEKERNDLKQKVAAVRKFLDSRITWTSHQRTLAACLPDNTFLTSLQGACKLSSSGKGTSRANPDNSLVLRGAVSVPEEGPVPREIDRLLDTLRAHPILTRDFPVVEMADLKQMKSANDGSALASFTVVCVPKGGAGTAK